MFPQLLTATALPLFKKVTFDEVDLEKSSILDEPEFESKAFPHRRWPMHVSQPDPHRDLNDWNLRIFGAVTDPLRVTWSDLAMLPETEATFDTGLTSFTEGKRHWQGADAWSLLGLAGVRSDAKWLIVHGEGGFHQCLELGQFLESPALLAHTVESRRLSDRDGGPIRLILPHFAPRFSTKWVRGLELCTERP